MAVREWLQISEPDILGTRVFEIAGRRGVQVEGKLQTDRGLC
jgi:hypothetical protein